MWNTAGKDFRASIVVFLVNLPFCLGVAAASGLSPAQGIASGIVGGLIAGLLGGAPLQVSGPAVGLIAVTLGLVASRGSGAFGTVVVMAGVLQMLAGLARLGGYAKLVPGAVVAATLVAAGAMQAVCQAHAVLGGRPLMGFAANAAGLLPHALHAGAAPLAVGLVTIGAIIFWERCAPSRLRAVPAALVGVVFATGFAAACAPGAAHIAFPETMAGVGLEWPTASMLTDPGLLATACVMAILASAESLMAGSATAAMIGGAAPRHDRELLALGASNLVCGLLCALPIAGIVVRSAANARAGARTRFSTVLHGVWMLLAMLFAGDVLRTVPVAALAALLVLGGARLVRVRQSAALTPGGAVMFGITLGTILAINLPVGVLVGCGCAALARAFRAPAMAGADMGEKVLEPSV